MHVFVTGCESFIGREFIAQCEAAGIAVSGVDAAPTARAGCRQLDIRSADVAAAIPEGVDAVVHLAALSRDPDCVNRGYDTFDVNVMGTLNLMQAAEQRRVRQFIFASTEWVYGDADDGVEKDETAPIDPQPMVSEYAFSKLVCEVNLRQKYQRGFMPVTILRFGIVYGPRKTNWAAVESLFHQTATAETITVGSLRTGRRFVHVRDLAEGIRAAIGVPGFEVINLEGAAMVTLRDVIETGMRIHGRQVAVIERAPERASVRNIANRKAQTLLNWTARTDLESGLRSLLGTVCG